MQAVAGARTDYENHRPLSSCCGHYSARRTSPNCRNSPSKQIAPASGCSAPFNYTEPTHGHGFHYESLFESFYRVCLTKSFEIGPDIQVSIHPTNNPRSYTTTLLNARARIIF